MSVPPVIYLPDETRPQPAATTGAETAMTDPVQSHPPSARSVMAHVFMISMEIALLSVQFFRMEALAFDVLPDLADIDLGFIYGSHLMGLIWLMVVILLSYSAWECAIRLSARGEDASIALRLGTVLIWAFNVCAMVFEFVLFRMLVDDFGSQGLGFAGAAELFGLLMVFTHQLASFWITKHVIREMFLGESDTVGPDPAANGDDGVSHFVRHSGDGARQTGDAA